MSCTRGKRTSTGDELTALPKSTPTPVLQKMGAEVRVFDPSTLPVKHDREPVPNAVKELRELSLWS